MDAFIIFHFFREDISEKRSSIHEIANALSIAYYSKGQGNPGIAINRKALDFLNFLDAKIDIDTYLTNKS